MDISDLDLVLNYLNDNRGGHTVFDINKGIDRLSNDDIDLIVDKLSEDNYIYKFPEATPSLFKIHYNGVILIQSDGYAGLYKRLKAEDNRNYVLNVATALGTSLAGAYGLLEIGRYVFGSFCHY